VLRVVEELEVVGDMTNRELEASVYKAKAGNILLI
jgi:hypothetical protein